MFKFTSFNSFKLKLEFFYHNESNNPRFVLNIIKLQFHLKQILQIITVYLKHLWVCNVSEKITFKGQKMSCQIQSKRFSSWLDFFQQKFSSQAYVLHIFYFDQKELWLLGHHHMYGIATFD